MFVFDPFVFVTEVLSKKSIVSGIEVANCGLNKNEYTPRRWSDNLRDFRCESDEKLS